MSKKRLITLLLLSFALLAEASVTITLRYGQQVRGELVMQNEEVVIIRNASGARFQYPTSEVLSVTEDVVEQEPTDDNQTVRQDADGKTSLGVRLVGGYAGFGGDFRLGANNVADRHIFIGGQVGYRGLYAEGRLRHVVPITIVADIPLMPTKHAPYIGAQIGYGIGIGGIIGGVNAGLEVGYLYQMSSSYLQVGLNAELQQLARVLQHITIDETIFTESTGKTTGIIGISLAILF